MYSKHIKQNTVYILSYTFLGKKKCNLYSFLNIFPNQIYFMFYILILSSLN